MEEDILQEIQGNRPRSRTWPLPQPDEVDEAPKTHEEEPSKLEASKKGSRKNAWGNLSYADLITQAITSSPEQRMTLSQIYTWMVENIPYFKDKGDSTSSAGWKNSIRHNLSLHNRFMRIQNEGNGKSSWWILNHDAKSEKTKRRNRSSSLDSDAGGPKVKTNKRGRKSTKRTGEVSDERPQSPSAKSRGNIPPKSPIGSEPSVIVEDSPFPFPMADYRHRSSSNASNVSSIGRLSPIPSHDEEESQDMAMSPAQNNNNVNGKTTPTPMTDELIENIKENLNMTIGQAQGEMPPFQRRTCSSNTEQTNMAAVVQSMNIDSPTSRYQRTANGFYPIPQPSVKQTFNHVKIEQQQQQKSVYSSEPTIVQRNGVFHGRSCIMPERSIVQQQAYSRPPPTYSQTMIRNDYVPKSQQVMGRLAFQSNHCSLMDPDATPMINVEMADRLPVDIDIDFLEGDIQCDVENVLRSELAFNDGYLDFNLDNYVPAIALPEMPIHGYISGSMVH